MGDVVQTYKKTHTTARTAFGRMLRIWRERNGWTQYTAERWGREVGFATLSSGNVSMVEQGKAGDLRAQAHFQLAEVNRRLAERDWGTLHSPELRQALEHAEAIRGNDGELWGPAEFWSCYVGLLPVPEAYRQIEPEPAPVLDERGAAELSAQWRQQVSAEASRRGLDPIETLQGAARQAPAAPRKSLRAVLAGFRDYRPEELTPLWQQGWLPERWIEAWRASLTEMDEIAELAEDITTSPAPGQKAVLTGKA
jgi:transcriptional regulator with XRE-family HTH domain